jgi:hypothetical protein
MSYIFSSINSDIKQGYRVVKLMLIVKSTSSTTSRINLIIADYLQAKLRHKNSLNLYERPLIKHLTLFSETFYYWHTMKKQFGG